jgi:proline dehydrogenase
VDRQPAMTSCWSDALRRRRSSAYGAGPTLDAAMEVGRRLARQGVASVIGYAARPGEPPRAVADVHLAAFERLAAEDLDCQVSVKLSALAFDAGLFAELEAASARSGRRLHVDALAPDTVDATWRLVDGAPPAGRLGTTLPGRWRRSAADAARAVRLGLGVRVVKGQWAGSGTDDVDPTAGFLAVVDRLGGHEPGVEVATHDVGLLAEAIRRLRAAGSPCTAELYFGLPFRGPALTARRLGVPIRVYVAYGSAHAPYGIADVAHDRAAAWWLVQDVALGREKTWLSIRRSHRARS